MPHLGKYELYEQLGRGGFGVVYRARDMALNVERAVKVLHPALTADPEFLERFKHEAQVAARLEHPHIVPVYDLTDAEGRVFLAMRYMPGGSLKDLLAREGKLPFERAVAITSQVATALEYAYRQPEKLVHRDVKPGNVLFEAASGDDVPAARLADFGFAKALSAASSASLSASGGMVGTPAYMPPEAWRGKAASPAGDVYSLACVFYEMITVQVLFAGESPPEVMTRHIIDGPQLPVAWPQGVPEGVGAVLRKALAKEPGERYAGAGAFAEALLMAQDEVHQREAARRVARLAEEKARREAEEKEQHQAEARAHKLHSLELAPGVRMELVHIPAGKFWMGSDPKKDIYASDGEIPQHEVYLDEYWIGKYPVTNLQYAAFVRATGQKASRYWRKGVIPKGKENHPVVEVSWYDAQAFCKWASQVTGEIIRLPSEAEWEKAARGTDQRIYPWGEAAPDKTRCNIEDWFGGTTPVGQFSLQGDSPYGCVDMAGNVWEWVVDWYAANTFATLPERNLKEPASGTYRVLRGGSWYVVHWVVRAASRGWRSPDCRNSTCGFRCSR